MLSWRVTGATVVPAWSRVFDWCEPVAPVESITLPEIAPRNVCASATETVTHRSGSYTCRNAPEQIATLHIGRSIA